MSSSSSSSEDPGRTLRLFIAIGLPETLRQRLGDVMASQRGGPKARWVRAANLHLTLRFLGDTEAARLPRLERLLERASRQSAPLELVLKDAGTFPRSGPARVVWVGLESPPELAALQRRVAAAAEEALGLEPEKRSFRAHLTVARCRPPWPRAKARRVVDALAEGIREPEAVFDVRSIDLIASELRPEGARYTTLGHYAFRG